MAVVLRTHPGKVTARGRKKSPKRSRGRSSRRRKRRKRRKRKKRKNKTSAAGCAGIQKQLASSEKARDLLMLKLEAITHSHGEYRKCCFELIEENEQLQARLIQVERECMEVIGYLREKRSAYETRLEIVEKDLAEIRGAENAKRQEVSEVYEVQISSLNTSMRDRDETIQALELKVSNLKDLKDTNVTLERKNEELNKELLDAMVRHQTQLVEYEAMILKEKKNLEQMAKQEVHNLVDKAHEIAAKNVGAVTMEVYNQNKCLNLAMKKYKRELAALEEMSARHESAARVAETRAELTETALRDLRLQHSTLQQTAEQLQQQLARSESDRRQEAVSLQEVRAELRDWALHERQADARQVQQLQRQLASRDATIQRLRQLARRILARRSQLEDFFLSALDHVNVEVADERRRFWKAAEQEYREQMAAGMRGDGAPPQVMTVDGSRMSSNDVADHWREYNQWNGDVHSMDVSALTWVQKESVLRVLFAHINSAFGRARKQRRCRRPRKKTADVGVQNFGSHKRKFSGEKPSDYPVFSPYIDKSVQMLGL